MNFNAIMSLLVFLTCIFHMCFGEPGCMDNSWHLKQPYDYKELHYATTSDGGYCKCPCSQHIAKYGKAFSQNKCPVCMHTRTPQPVIILKNALNEYKNYEQRHGNSLEKTPIHSTKKRLSNRKKTINLCKNLCALNK